MSIKQIYIRLTSFGSDYSYRRNPVSWRREVFGEEVTINTTGTGETVLGGMGTDEQFKAFMKELEDMRAEFGPKAF